MLVVLVIIPVVVLALKSPSILNIYLISDLVVMSTKTVARETPIRRSRSVLEAKVRSQYP